MPQTANVVFVADDLGAWLVGLLADAGRRTLTALVLGSDQERALRKAAAAAVQDTAAEMSPSVEQAGQFAIVISEVFREPAPDMALAGSATILEGLQAGIARQLAVLDDVGRTGTGQSSADILGVLGTVLADRLTGHLVREIIVRGAGGGPLTPLADQLNHELTRLQGQRIEGMLAQLAAHVRAAPAQLNSGVAVAGRPLDEMTDPFALEVHRPVRAEGSQPGLPALPALPAYVPRHHDTELGSVVRTAAAGRSGIAVLTGGSSTGKTRACWEALQLLREQSEPWRLWHPIDPSRPDAALRELPSIGPRTVVWLNEAQFYLDMADGGLGERVAAGLRELLRDANRAPVLVLATLWPQFWDALTARSAGGIDSHAQARELLVGHDINLPAAFTPAQLHELSRAGDARLVQAAAAALDGQVTQFLAGAPELLARYRNAPPAATALIHAAMDARRLGMGIGLSQAFLAAAAPGYLSDTEWDALGEDWLEQALAYTAVPCRGIRGPLTRIRPRPARPRGTRTGSPDSGEQQADITDVPLYRLADYLDQHGRQHRKEQIPPAGFWAAATDHTSPSDQDALGDAALDRGLYRAGAQLFKNAGTHGNRHANYYYLAAASPLSWASAHVPVDDPYAAAVLLGRLKEAGAPEQVAALADRVAAHVSLDNADAVSVLLYRLKEAGTPEQVAALLRRDPAAHVSLGNPRGVANLLGRLRQAGAAEQAAALADRVAAQVCLGDPADVDHHLGFLQFEGGPEQVAALLRRDPAAHVSLDDPAGVAGVLGWLRKAGAPEQVTAVLRRDPAAHVSLDNPRHVARLLDRLKEAGALEQVTALLRRDPAAHVSLDSLGVAHLLDRLKEAGALEQAAALAHRAAAHVPLDSLGLAHLLGSLREAGAPEQAAALAHRAARVPLDDPYAVARLLSSLRSAGADEQVTALADRASARVSLDDARAVDHLLRMMWFFLGAREHAAALLRRDPAAHVSLDDPNAVNNLLAMLDGLAPEQVTALLRRDPAAHVSLDDPNGVAYLLHRLWSLGAAEQATALADRAAANVPVDDPKAVAQLLDSLKEAGADKQATALANRVAARVSLDDARAVDQLLGRLRETGAPEQAAALADRLPGAGMFMLFIQQQGHQDRFPFGREADGRPSEPWDWDDLD